MVFKFSVGRAPLHSLSRGRPSMHPTWYTTGGVGWGTLAGIWGAGQHSGAKHLLGIRGWMPSVGSAAQRWISREYLNWGPAAPGCRELSPRVLRSENSQSSGGGRDGARGGFHHLPDLRDIGSPTFHLLADVPYPHLGAWRSPTSGSLEGTTSLLFLNVLPTAFSSARMSSCTDGTLTNGFIQKQRESFVCRPIPPGLLPAVSAP